MKILLAKPYGYCYGVSRAMEIASKAKKEHPDEEVYLIGAPVHNEEAISSLEAMGLLLLDGDFPSLEKKLNGLKEGSVVVFSAHGHPHSFDEVAKRRSLIVYDGTCSFVEENLSLALSSPNLLYIGSEGHAEKEAFLANCPGARFYDARSGKGDWKECACPPTLICQTTLSGEEIKRAKEEIKATLGEFKLAKGRCTATKIRQEKVASLSKEADATVVLGSRTSNNATKLLQIASYNGPAYLCLDEKEVLGLDLSSFGTVLVCSSASTSKEIVDKVVRYLSSL